MKNTFLNHDRTLFSVLLGKSHVKWRWNKKSTAPCNIFSKSVVKLHIRNGSCLTDALWLNDPHKKIGKKILDYWCKREKGGGIPFNLSPMDFISSVCVVGSAKTSNEVELLRAHSPTNSRYCCCCCTHRVGTKKIHQTILSSFNFKELSSISGYFLIIWAWAKELEC